MAAPSAQLHGSQQQTGAAAGYPESNIHIEDESNSLGMMHASEVLASFTQFPIRKVSQLSGYGNEGSPSTTYMVHHDSSGMSDPLLHDIQAHSRDLLSTLIPILQTQEGDPGTRYDINNCKGVNHIAGSMMPPPDEDDLSRMSSPTSKSSLGSSIRPPSTIQTSNLPPVRQTYQPSTIKQEIPPLSPIKAETPGFQTTFQFVVNEDAKEARNTVRKHVMKEFRRRERWEQGQKGVVMGASIEKPQSAGLKKRRRRQDTPSDGGRQIANETQPPSDMTMSTPTEPRRDSIAQAKDIPSAESEYNGQTTDLNISPINTRTFSSHGTITRAPQRKKTKPLTPPVFPDSRQHQLWGAVTTDYDSAIFELENNNSRIAPYQHDPWASVAVGQVDPFTKLNLDLGPATQSLLHHFAWVMPSLMDSIVTGKTFHRIGWLYSAVAIHDPTPVHVILGYTLGHIASLRGLEEPPQALEHKSKAIKLLHHRMGDPKQCYSDGLIGAIVNFAGWELICANPKAYAMHMSGLGRIVTARGGMSAFKDSPELETVIVRLDAIRAYLSQSSPRYPAFSCVRDLEPVAINIPPQAGKSTWAPATQARPSSYTPSTYRYCEDALTLMNKLEDVLLLCRSAASDLSGPVGEPFHKLLIKSMEQMLTKPTFLVDERGRNSPSDIYAAYAPHQPSTTDTPEEERARLNKSSLALRLAALTLLDVAIREFFDSPPYPGYYTARLKERFLGSKAMANDTSWGRSLEMLIAVMMQADRMALERPWRAWYAADALTLTMRMSEWKWEEVGNTLRVWVQQGGLESAQPRTVEEVIKVGIDFNSTSTRATNSQIKACPPANGAKLTTSSPAGPNFDPEPRSKDVWDLREVAGKFLAEWEHTSGQLSPASNSEMSPTGSSQQQQQQQQQQEQALHSQPQPQSQQSQQQALKNMTHFRRQSHPMPQNNANINVGSGIGSGKRSRSGDGFSIPVTIDGISYGYRG